MPFSLREVVAALDRLYPQQTASSWDRVGLVSGDPDQPISLVHFAVDPTLAVIDEARAAGADLLVTHHPLLLRGVHSVATTSAKGAAVAALIVNNIALYAAHTNADVASPGVCDALAEACGLVEVGPLEVVDGIAHGRVGSLTRPLRLREFVEHLDAGLPRAVGGIRVAGPADALVSRVAVVGGAGDGFLDAVTASGADVYVTADLRHHPALEAREEARGGTPYLVDAGHWATEWLWLRSARAELLRELSGRGSSLNTDISTLRTDPWDFLIGAAASDGSSDITGGTP
ncbi:MAG: Nif3-like dinuclear metal center hexameric protein [Dermatophilaceae bacterium]|nr:Nif3-like dinuclear metal center hexameric protein [Dermatophilaceae bacterium]